MAITASDIKKLRDATGISMMECKKALVETDWDVEKAIEVLRKRGLAKAAKAADRETSEGGIKILVENDKAFVVAVACETDFVAITPEFNELLEKMVEVLKTKGSTEAATDEVEALRTEAVLKMWENLTVKKLEILSGAKFGYYIHSNKKEAAIAVAKDTGVDEVALKQVAMHITASKPEYLKTTDIPESFVAKETEIAMEQMKNDPKMANKPEQVLEKILEGKIAKIKAEISLLTQDFVIDNTKKVKDFIGEDTLETFQRITI